MKPNNHAGCGGFPARISGKSWQTALSMIEPNHKFPKFRQTDWVTVCPQCDAYALGNNFEKQSQWPFLCSDEVWRVMGDFGGHGGQTPNTGILKFGDFEFSKHALDSAIHRVQEEDINTSALEATGEQLNENSDFLDFCQKVCAWGGGLRVFANLIRKNNKTELNRSLRDWLLQARRSASVEEAISVGIQIDGLAVSFASKHLRMIDPQKYAVLDSVLSKGFGFALNPKGYRLFMKTLSDFKVENHLTEKLATLESGIFYMIRQQVSSRDDDRLEATT